ncbi:spore cortex biosynthesis protein YabQ [Clostridium scatologenes]|uniref:Spore cortex biosynthesis protein YabQ n=1 Tax=Clostridium scatologenes TaxID=1548 RepID=A0A0E3GS31_CLOSL|nr:spore cortex biosynthesis protein YabQ [Clostridium scatologenes]AKA71361.1 spore cortex biosynthesis protein YabQ [Clostridium scatologenes]
MILSITQQLRCIIFSLIAGIITGILFDLYRIIRGLNNINKILTFVEDILFWILASIIIFIFLLFIDCLYVGVYIYAGITLGAYLYIKIFSNTFIKFQYKLIKNVRRTFRVLKNIVFYPFMIIIYIIKTKNKRNYKK